MINVEKLKPSGIFSNYIYKTIPLAFDESMSYYETLCGLLSYLKDTVTPTVDNNADALIELQNYVEHYFDNLNVQEEINNKLDEMAENGTLEEIITHYLQMAGVLGYNTVSDMVNATNIIEGSICRTLGNLSYNDGKGAFYKIRTITNEDVVDGVNIIALNISNTLIAELIPNYYINNLQTQINSINEDINNILNRKFLFIGDSYGVHTTERGTTWIEYVINELGLTLNTNAFISAEGSCGFIGDPNLNDKTFLRKLQEAYNNIDNPQEITDIIIGGGVNDSTYSSSQLQSAISTFMTNAKTLFPNAKVSVGMISWSKNKTYLNSFSKIIMCYQLVRNYGGTYIDGSECCWHYNSWLYDAVHPIQGASQQIAQCIVNYINCGTGALTYGQAVSGILTTQNNFTLSSSYFNTEQIGNMINIISNIVAQHTGYSYTFNGNWLKIATFENCWLCGSGNKNIPVKTFIVDSSNNVHTFIMDLKIEENGIFIRGYEKVNNTTTDLSLTIKTIIINNVGFTLPAVGN